jgi:hypothetical protein
LGAFLCFFSFHNHEDYPMQTTIQIGKLKYRICAPTDQRPTLARLYKEDPNRPWEDVRQHLTPEALLAERVKELKAYALQCTGRHRKVRVYPGPRVFPASGLCAKAYVTAYYALNQLGNPSHFATLAEHVSYPQGCDSQVAP